MTALRRYCAAAAGILAILRLTSNAPASCQAPAVRSLVDYVTVDVIATDGKNNPVLDLTERDFQIVEVGRVQAIRDFQFVSVPPRNPVAIKEPAAAPAVTDRRPEISRAFAIVVDDLHLVESDIVPLKRTLTEIVRSLAPADEAAIVFVGRANLGENFTTDAGRLMAAVARQTLRIESSGANWRMSMRPPGSRTRRFMRSIHEVR